jgi:indole-3-glycerol phosphate synthase
MTAHTQTVLERILESTRAEVGSRKRELPAEELEYRAFALGGGDPAGFRAALRAPGIAVIAEFKRRSPSAGTLREAADVRELVGAYERGGASALSVLTEGPNFDGSLEDLRAARAVCELPILRKDFILDEYQLHEALLARADAVLLIVAALEPEELRALHEGARKLGLDVLVEVHDRDELQTALKMGAELIGINNRDVRDFSVDVERTARLMGEIPAGVTVISESGITRAEQLSLTLALLVVPPIPHAGGDAIGRGDEVWTERVDELRERDHRAVRREADGGYDLTCPVADGRGDRVQLGRKLLVVDREALLTDLVELVAQRLLACDRVRAALCQLHRGEDLASLLLGEIRQQQLAHRGAVGRQARPRVQAEVDLALLAAEAAHAIDVHDLRSVQHG